MQHPLVKLLSDNIELYRNKEIGDGAQSFTKQVLEQVFGLTPKSALVQESNLFGDSLYDNFYIQEGSKKTGDKARRDFRCKINGQLVVVETEKLDNIQAGMKQIAGYMRAENTMYGIVTDGREWRFFKSGPDQIDQYETLMIESLCSEDGSAFLQNFYNTYEFYLQRLSGVVAMPFDTQVFHQGLITAAERIVFDLRHIGLFSGNTKEIEKQEIQTAYSLIIQLLLIKIVQDKKQGLNLLKKDIIITQLQQEDRQGIFESVEGQIKWLGEFYVPYHNQQDSLLGSIISHYQKEGSRFAKLTLDSVRLFLDLYHFIYSFDFKEVKQDLFGAVYENYLKELYKDDDTKKGQVFTPPEIVDFMLDEVGYTIPYLQKTIDAQLVDLIARIEDPHFNIDGLSIIDPACGSGTFLYKASGRIVNAILGIKKAHNLTDLQAGKIAELLICNNVVGFDIEPFPLYLAEMNILQTLLFFNVGQEGNVINPIDNPIQIFSTDDSIAEFHNLEQSMEKDLQDLIQGGSFHTLSAKRNPQAILQLKADLQEFDMPALMLKFELAIYHQELQSGFFIVNDQLITTKQKTYRDTHAKKLLACATRKELLVYVNQTLDVKYLSIFEKNIKNRQSQIDHMKKTLEGIFMKQKTKRTKFDFVVANPPYIKSLITYESKNIFGININDPRYAQIQMKDGTTIRIGNSSQNLYVYFYYLGYFLLKNGASLCYITPRSTITQPATFKLRQFLKINTTIKRIYDFGKSYLFYGRGLNESILVGTDSTIILLEKRIAPDDDTLVNIISYPAGAGKITLNTFLENQKHHKIQYKLLFSAKDKGYLFQDYFSSLKDKDEDFHMSIYSGIYTSKTDDRTNSEHLGLPIFPHSDLYYLDVDACYKWYEYPDVGIKYNKAGPMEFPTTKEIISKKYKISWSGRFSGNEKVFMYTDYCNIQSRDRYVSLGVNKIQNIPELMYLFGLFNSERFQNKIQKEFSGVCNMTNLRQMTVPLLNTPAKLSLKSQLIVNSEAIINLCKHGAATGPQTRGDICETTLDIDAGREVVTVLKDIYRDTHITIDHAALPTDVLPDALREQLATSQTSLTALEEQRDAIVKQLYELS